MSILMNDQCVAQRILDHIEHGPTDLGQSVWHEPVDSYRSDGRMAAEIELAFRRSPTPFCPFRRVTGRGVLYTIAPKGRVLCGAISDNRAI